MASGTVGYDSGPFSISALVRYIGASKYDNTFIGGVNINDNSVPSVTYVNFMANYNVNDHYQVFGVVRNAFDRASPPVLTSFGYPTKTTGSATLFVFGLAKH